MRIRSRLLTRIAAGIAVLIVRALFWSCRKEALGDVDGVNPYESTGDRRYLYCMWHDQLIMTIFSGRPQQMAGLVSRHQDGSYLADAMEMVGIRPVRGSSKRGGDLAMREMLEAARDFHIAITPDGPRGPRHHLKQGIVFLASHSGRKIIPIAHSASRIWRIQGGWSDLMLPQPFATIYARGGVPFEVPAGASREELQEYGRRLQAEMQRLERDVEQWAKTGKRPDVTEVPVEGGLRRAA